MRPWFALPALLFLTISLAYAETPATGSGSQPATGSGISSVDAWPAQRAVRADLLRKNLPAFLKREGQWQSQQTEYLQKRADHRLTCRAELRQANRDAMLPTLLRCFRGELTMEREQLRQERDYVMLTLGIGDALRAESMRRIDLLRDAINTITGAIDSGVYQTQAALAEGKRKLHVNYRAKLDSLRSLIRADHTLSWNALLLDDAQNDLTGTGSTISPQQNGCLMTQETALRSIVTPGTGATVTLPEVLTGLLKCVQDIQRTMGSGSMTVSQ